MSCVVGASIYSQCQIQVEELLAWRKAGAWNRAILAVGGLATAERQELIALRRECRQLREDVGILKRATAFFAKETR